MPAGRLTRLWSDTDGAAFLEFTVFALFFFTLLFGIVDFTFAYFQWNAATKAVQLGARLAAVSEPIAAGLRSRPWKVAGYTSGDDDIALSDGYSCTCTSSGCTSGDGARLCPAAATAPSGCTTTYCGSALNTLVYGRGNGACDGSPPNIGMCNMFWRITPDNVRVTYDYTGLGYAGRPFGPVPTIRVELVGLTFQFFFLGGLLGFDDITIPGLASTVTGEDLSAAGG
jgi:hypothetical protein